MKTITKKEPHHSGFEGWDIETSDGVKWSVKNFGGEKWKSTYNTPELKEIYESVYHGWEAFDGKNIIRADSEEKVIKDLLDF